MPVFENVHGNESGIDLSIELWTYIVCIWWIYTTCSFNIVFTYFLFAIDHEIPSHALGNGRASQGADLRGDLR